MGTVHISFPLLRQKGPWRRSYLASWRNEPRRCLSLKELWDCFGHIVKRDLMQSSYLNYGRTAELKYLDVAEYVMGRLQVTWLVMECKLMARRWKLPYTCCSVDFSNPLGPAKWILFYFRFKPLFISSTTHESECWWYLGLYHYHDHETPVFVWYVVGADA